MRHLRISELLLWSDRERAARKIPFHPRTTVVIGENDTGKSSVLKSLYWTFGAEPYTVHDSWRTAGVSSVVRFSIDDVPYSILKKGDVHAVFDATGRLLGCFHRVTTGLGLFLANLLAFKLRLTSQKNEIITPPPAYFFLPFYIDQDGGWSDNWSSFARLQQIPKWRTSVVEYHTGLKPNEYYEARAALQITEDGLRSQRMEVSVLRDVRDRMQRQTHTAKFDVSLEAFRDQLDELLQRCGELLAVEERLKATMQELSSTRLSLQNQRKLVEYSRSELSLDYAFATKELVHDSVDCPVCGATYTNSFADRFQIAKDEDRLTELLFDIDKEIRSVDEKLQHERRAFSDNRSEVMEVSALLETTREEVSLAMVLQSEGRKEVDAIFLAQLDEAMRRLAELDERASGLREQLKSYDDRDRRSEILGRYRQEMQQNVHALNCSRLGDAPFKRIDARIKESGSDQPRALLAYFFAILHVMARYSTTTCCPIVIDSPNQQAQDRANLPGMLTFIRDRLPEDSQLILGLEDTYGVEFPGSTILLDHKDKLLLETDYAAVRAEVGPLLDSALGPQRASSETLPFDEA